MRCTNLDVSDCFSGDAEEIAIAKQLAPLSPVCCIMLRRSDGTAKDSMTPGFYGSERIECKDSSAEVFQRLLKDCPLTCWPSVWTGLE